VDEVALGILAGMFLGAILGSRKTEAANDARDGEAAPPSSEQ
jgi:hypothetical protein